METWEILMPPQDENTHTLAHNLLVTYMKCLYLVGGTPYHTPLIPSVSPIIFEGLFTNIQWFIVKNNKKRIPIFQVITYDSKVISQFDPCNIRFQITIISNILI
jgi:hypothetical protein